MKRVYIYSSVVWSRVCLLGFVIGILSVWLWQPYNASAELAEAEKQAIQGNISQKSEELKKLSEQIKTQQQQLQAAQNQKQSLVGDLSKIDTTMKQMELGIKSSQTMIKKLEYEIEALQDDIEIAKKDMDKKEQGLAVILQQMQKNDSENLLYVFLKNKTISDSFFEAQSLRGVNDQLLKKIQEVGESKKKFEGVLEKASVIKSTKEQEKELLENKKVITEEIKQEKKIFLEQTKNKEKVYLTVLQELEKKQNEIAQEIEAMESQLRAKINYKNLPTKSVGLLQKPVDGVLTQGYGATAFAQKAYKGKWHNGLDFGAPIGSSLYAAEDGTVVAVANQDLYCRRAGYGKFVVIKHTNGLTTLYAHLSIFKVSEGQTVKRGDVIGLVGNTGFATGPHLHFTVYDSQTFKMGPSNYCGPKMPFGGDINPQNYL